MKRKPHSTSLVLLLVCIFAFWWGISVLSQNSFSDQQVPQLTSTSAANPALNPSVEPSLVVHQSVSGTTYTYSGSYVLANQCDTMGSGIRYSPDNGGQVTVLLTTSPSDTDCAQAADNSGQPFSVSIKLQEGQVPQFDGVTLNGAPIPAQLDTAN